MSRSVLVVFRASDALLLEKARELIENENRRRVATGIVVSPANPVLPCLVRVENGMLFLTRFSNEGERNPLIAGNIFYPGAGQPNQQAIPAFEIS